MKKKKNTLQSLKGFPLEMEDLNNNNKNITITKTSYVGNLKYLVRAQLVYNL